MDENAFLIVGQIVAPFGVNGELKVRLYTDFPEQFASRRKFYLRNQHDVRRLFALKRIRFHKNHGLFSFDGISTKEEAETFRGSYVEIQSREAALLRKNQFFIFEILGMHVFSQDGSFLGVVSEILKTGANDVYVVKPREKDGAEFLIPAISSVVKFVDINARRMEVQISPEWVLTDEN